MTHMQYEFRLFGGYAGKTIVINGHKFINGVYRTVLVPTAAASLTKVLAYYGAYHKGSVAYEAALAKEQGHGADEVHAGSKRRPADPVPYEGEPDGTGSSEARGTDDGAGAVGSAGDGSSSSAAGSGREDTGVPKFEDAASYPEPSEPSSVGNEDIKTAMLKLDPENDDHWVRTGAAAGKPRLSAVETAYGRAGLTREDLEAAFPGWDRDKAIERMLESD